MKPLFPCTAACVLFVTCWAGAASATTARYSATFDATWSLTTHPNAYPAGAHFSSLIGGVHHDQVVFWAPGELASPGIEQMAEVGGTTNLRNEVQAAINVGTASAVIQVGGVPSPGSTSVMFQVSEQFPLVTLVTMVAPSPDWFVGVHGFDLHTPNGWENQVSVDLFAYDAGTEEGTGFSLVNPDTVPKMSIALLGFPFMAGDPLLGKFTFTRIFAGRSIGDYDDSGVVDSADYVVWQDAIGDAGDNLPADGNLDGKIDTNDYIIWRNHFGQSVGGASVVVGLDSSVVPEPTAAVLLLSGVAILAARSCRSSPGR